MSISTEAEAQSIVEPIRPFARLGRDDVDYAGGKGANLGELTSAGLPVPDGFVVGAPAYAAFLVQTGLRDRLAQLLDSVNAEDTSELQAAGAAAREMGGDVASAMSVLDVDVEWHDQAAIPGADVHRGREAVSRHFEQWFDAWNEIDYTPEELLDFGDRILVVVRRHGKGKASGVEVTDQVTYVYTVRSDKIVRFEAFSEKADALNAVGLTG